jgi:Tfp pilus assembly protein PilE
MKKNINKKIILNSDGIALVTVILIIAILGILAAVAIETTGSDIINAGNITSSEQTLNVSNSAMNFVLSQLGTNALPTNYNIGLPAENVCYYSNGVNSVQAYGGAQGTCPLLSAVDPNSFSLSSMNFSAVTVNNFNFGFEYIGTYGSCPGGYNITQYKCYNGEIEVIAEKNIDGRIIGQPIEAGMFGDYGPFPNQIGYNQQ